MYNRYSSVNEHWLKCREIVLAKKQPRPMFVQANTKLQSQSKAIEKKKIIARILIRRFGRGGALGIFRFS